MKDGLRFVDCDMHIMEPVDLFDRYLDARFKDLVNLQVGADGRPRRGTIVIDGLPTTQDAELTAVPQTESARRHAQHPAPVGIPSRRHGRLDSRSTASTTPRPR